MTIFTKAAQMLQQADTIQKARELQDLALTAAEWAKRKGLGEEAVRYANSYALAAERRIGEMTLAAARAGELATRGRPKENVPAGDIYPATTAEVGLTRKERNEAEFLAELPEEDFEKIKTGEKSRKQARAEAKRTKQKEEHKRKREKPPPISEAGIYQIVLADPPWKYDHQKAKNRDVENQYPTADLATIKSHNPKTEDNAILFLWDTATKLKEALEVIDAWGFRYVTNAVWDKQKIGMGYWFRGQHELLLVGTKGEPGTVPEHVRGSSVFSEARGQHSQKPESVYRYIEEAFPDRTKLEMYCRTPRKHWAAWGNEA